MVFKCGQFLLLTFILIMCIAKCFGMTYNGNESDFNEVFSENAGSFNNLGLKLMESFMEMNKTDILNGMKGTLKEVARKKGGGSNQGSLMDSILPILLLPFLVSSSMIPGMLLSIKVLLIKGAIIGKIALILMLLNFFRRRVDGGGVINHYPPDLAKEHYGYQGIEEPGAYVNKRRRKRQIR